MARKEHWENIYANKQMNEVSWFQQEPTTSVSLIQKNTQFGLKLFLNDFTIF